MEELLPEMRRFYAKAEQKLGQSFLRDRKITKLFTELQEEQLWQKKAKNELSYYLEANIYTSHPVTGNNYSQVLQCGNLNLPLFLQTVRHYFEVQKAYIEEQADYSQITINGSGCRYKDIEAESMVFCEGWRNSLNPWFNYIPLKPAKGETLTIHCHGLQIEDVLNKGIFIMPLGDARFKIGATYEWSSLTDEPSEAGKLELQQKLNQLMDLPYTILQHEAGVRPAVIDRRPIIGSHPRHHNLYIFNGLGTKGVMLAPWCATQLLQFTEQGKAVPAEIDVERFRPLCRV